jgi:hypothetical protein
MSTFSEVLRILWLILWWGIFNVTIIASALSSLLLNQWHLSLPALIGGPLILILALDPAHKEGIEGKANGGSFHLFYLTVVTINAVFLAVLTVLTLSGILHIDPGGLSTDTNFASWFLAGGLFIAFFLIQRVKPNDDIPDLQRMEQLDRRSTRVGVVSAAIFTILCLVVPLTSFMTAGYDPAALAVALFLAPGFLRIVREGLFYLQSARFEEGAEEYRVLRVVCVGVAGLAGCIALGYLGYSLVRKEWLPALFFAASLAMNGWSVKKYVTVGITIPEKEEADSSSHASVQEAE